MKKFKMMSMILFLSILGGCTQRPCNMTPQEEANYRELESVRVQEVLTETSYRNSHNWPNWPKANPEFSMVLPDRRCPE